jgi:hypothetical protein
MHGRGHLLPAGDVCGSVNARRSEVALAIIRRLSAFGDDQADAGALGIIFGGQFSRRAVARLRVIGAMTRRFGRV